ncbi:MAG TPA: CCA tRNA nucleotidyltransferase [Mycobacteriales bacterium]
MTSPSDLVPVHPVADELGRLFERAGYHLHLVGGTVRDALLGRAGPDSDLDFATDALPDAVLSLLEGLGSTWTTGIEFGTVGALVQGVRCEITTYRADRYDRVSRNPVVRYGDSLDDDLRRRDFTMNAMAISVPGRVFADPYGGLRDLAAGALRTPADPAESFADDPLRMLRAARFVAQLGVTPADEVVAAMTSMAAELGRITVERVQAELSKLILGAHPRRGLELLVDTGLADVVLPELPALRMEIDEHHQHKDVYAHSLTVLDQVIALEGPDGPDLVLRLAALLHDIGKPATRRHESGGGVSFHHHEVVGAKLVRARLRELKYPKDVVEDVARLTLLHLRFHGYGRGEWSDSAVRRYVTDAGPLLERLHKLVRSDCTTRNRRRAAALARSYDALEERIARIQAEEDLRAVRPDLDGNEIMRLLGLPPGPLVGQAWRHLKELRLDRGPLSHDEAVAELHRWATDHDLP